MSELIKVADAWERERRGNNPGTYIVAVAGGMKFLLLRKHRADENGSTWMLFITARGDRKEHPSAHEAQRGRATAAASREIGSSWSKRQRDEP
jgi:hypothetical protein